MAASNGCFMSLSEARQKCTEKHSCFQQIQHTEHMCLPPNYIGRLKEGINEELSRKLMKFCDKLEAVIVAYDKIELLQRFGSLVDETPFLHFDVKVNYIVFKPEMDSKLVGEVNKLGYDHIGCLVHQCFNASITRPKIQNGYDVDSLVIGSRFTFRVIGLESLNGVLLISGVIDDKSLRKSKTKSKNTDDKLTITRDIDNDNTSKETINNKRPKDRLQEPSSTKKKKDVNGNQSNMDSQFSDGSSGVLKLVRKKTKKSKKVYAV